MKLLANAFRSITVAVHRYSASRSLLSHCRFTVFRAPSASAFIQRGVKTSSSVSQEPVRHSKQVREYILRKTRVREMTDPAVAAELQPLQASVKEQVYNRVVDDSVFYDLQCKVPHPHGSIFHS